MESINERGFVLQIVEYGKIVRQYHDTDHARFMLKSSEMVSDHLSRNAYQKGTNGNSEVKNLTFHIFTN